MNYADPSLGIEWENLAEAEVSEADKNHPLLKDVKPLKKEVFVKRKEYDLNIKKLS